MKAYKVHFNTVGIGATKRTFTVLFDQSKLDEILGRYTRLYGPPLDMELPNKGVTEYQFYKSFGPGKFVEISVLFRLASEGEIADHAAKQKSTKVVTPVMSASTEPVVEAAIPDKMKPFIEHNLLIRVS